LSTLHNPDNLESNRVMQLPVGAIAPNPAQPRRIFSEESLQELAQSILHYGVIQPLMVRRCTDGYELVAGERRLRAARLVGLREVPCILTSLNPSQSELVTLIENLQRRELDYIEEAEGIARIMRMYGLSQEQIAVRLGKSQSTVANKLRLLRHTPLVREALRRHNLSERHARALLRLPTERSRLEVIGEIVHQSLSVSETEAYIDTTMRQYSIRQESQKIKSFFSAVHDSLRSIQNAGIEAGASRQENEQEIILTIRISKSVS